MKSCLGSRIAWVRLAKIGRSSLYFQNPSDILMGLERLLLDVVKTDEEALRSSEIENIERLWR